MKQPQVGPPEARASGHRALDTVSLYLSRVGQVPLLAPGEELALTRQVKESLRERVESP